MGGVVIAEKVVDLGRVVGGCCGRRRGGGDESEEGRE